MKLNDLDLELIRKIDRLDTERLRLDAFDERRAAVMKERDEALRVLGYRIVQYSKSKEQIILNDEIEQHELLREQESCVGFR